MKWPATCLIFGLSLWASQGHAAALDGPAPVPAPLCAPDAPLDGLLAAVEAARSRLTGLDAEAVADLVAVVETYRDERAGLCRQVAGLTAQAAALRESLAIQQGLGERCRADRAAAWDELEARIKAPLIRPGRAALGWNIGAGACADAKGRFSLCGAAVFGLRF